MMPRCATPSARQSELWDHYDAIRRHDAEQGSRLLLEAQVRHHQYPCKIRGEADIAEALGE